MKAHGFGNPCDRVLWVYIQNKMENVEEVRIISSLS
jgi:hypothetical protein